MNCHILLERCFQQVAQYERTRPPISLKDLKFIINVRKPIEKMNRVTVFSSCGSTSLKCRNLRLQLFSSGLCMSQAASSTLARADRLVNNSEMSDNKLIFFSNPQKTYFCLIHLRKAQLYGVDKFLFINKVHSWPGSNNLTSIFSILSTSFNLNRRSCNWQFYYETDSKSFFTCLACSS